MSEKAEQLATVLLESDEEANAQELIAKWDRAHASYIKLSQLKRKSLDLFNELGASIGLNRELAKLGLKWADVARWIQGQHVGATDNYKREFPVKVCRDKYCPLRSDGGLGQVYRDGVRAPAQPMEAEKCAGCGGPLDTVMQRTTPSELRGKLGNYTVGVELKDGRKVWFKDPVPHKTHQY